MIVVGLDPGLANLGYAVVNVTADSILPMSLGVITTAKSDKKLKVLASDDNTRRGREVSRAFRGLLTGLNVDLFCVEAKSFPRNSSSAAKTAISWGIVIDIAEERDIPIFQARPQEVKKALCGKTSASKVEMQRAVDAYFGAAVTKPLVEGLTKTRLEHPYDALATVVACSDAEAFRFMRRASCEV